MDKPSLLTVNKLSSNAVIVKILETKTINEA